MSKYAEAIARKIDEKNYYHDCMISYLDNEPVSEHYKYMMEKASLELEALQIADRLEQFEKKMARRMICDTCSEAETCGQGELGDWCGEYDVLLKTVKIALADIRGEENGK